MPVATRLRGPGHLARARPLALSLVALACLAGCGGGSAPKTLHDYTVTVTASITPSPVAYTGNCLYVLNDKLLRLPLSGAGVQTENFSAHELKSMVINKRSGHGLMSVQVQRDGEIIFDSGPFEHQRRVVFEPRSR